MVQNYVFYKDGWRMRPQNYPLTESERKSRLIDTILGSNYSPVIILISLTSATRQYCQYHSREEVPLLIAYLSTRRETNIAE